MLKQPDGATIVEIAKALDWQPHTVRGAIAGALKKKLGLNVESEKVDDRGRVYRHRRVAPADQSAGGRVKAWSPVFRSCCW